MHTAYNATSAIQNQAPYGRAWTSNFIGQQKCIRYQCATILSDGRVQFNGVVNGVQSVPYENSPAAITHTFCFGDAVCSSESARAIPLLTDADRYYGRAASDWTVERF
jgi:hypothetical protein